ncbi:MAG: DUF4911 domain-containing protein [Thermodesulfobacteria bacterium]|nr:DUF4911 domain-containing protein [Thermodesulfobacteriota bacterium]
MKSKTLIVKLPTQFLAFFKFIFEGYDHLVSLTVIDPKEAKVKIAYFYKNEELVFEILEGLKTEEKIPVFIQRSLET